MHAWQPWMETDAPLFPTSATADRPQRHQTRHRYRAGQTSSLSGALTPLHPSIPDITPRPCSVCRPCLTRTGRLALGPAALLLCMYVLYCVLLFDCQPGPSIANPRTTPLRKCKAVRPKPAFRILLADTDDVSEKHRTTEPASRAFSPIACHDFSNDYCGPLASHQTCRRSSSSAPGVPAPNPREDRPRV